MHLSRRLPIHLTAPEIQSYDGICIDVIWDPLILSIVNDCYAISHDTRFVYCDTSDEALNYIVSVLVNTET